MSGYSVTVGGRARIVEIDDAEGDGRMRIVVDGRERVLDVRALGAGSWSLFDGSTARLIQVDGTAPKVTVEVSHPDGEPRICVAEVNAARADAPGGGPAAANAGPVTLRAPIPGRVVKVLATPGLAVAAGQALLVLEAMKMENELRAPRAGTVLSVHVAEGSTVDTGQALIVLD
ncbi:MAG: biotin/lipoyl-containing protein [Pseudomonadota bacterium]